MAKDLATMMRPLLGAKLTIELDKDLQVVKDATRSKPLPSRKGGFLEGLGTAIMLGQFDQALSEEQLEKMVVQSLTKYLPRKPVAVGESWTSPEKMDAPRHAEWTATMQCRLVSIGKHKGKRCAKIQIDIKTRRTASHPAKLPDNVMDVRLDKWDSKGLYWFDIDAGQMVEMTLDRDIRILTKTEMQIPGVNESSGPTTMDQRMKTKRRVIAKPVPAGRTGRPDGAKQGTGNDNRAANKGRTPKKRKARVRGPE